MSLFPEVDKEISEIQVELHKFIQNIIDESEIYAPSNGSEGYMFVDYYCDQCHMDDGEDKICDIKPYICLTAHIKILWLIRTVSFYVHLLLCSRSWQKKSFIISVK